MFGSECHTRNKEKVVLIPQRGCKRPNLSKTMQGQTKENCVRVRKASISCSRTLRNLYSTGKLVPWSKGLTVKTDRRLRKISRKVRKTKNSKEWKETKGKTMRKKLSDTRRRLCKEGKIISWSKGKTKDTDVRLRNAGRKQKRKWRKKYKKGYVNPMTGRKRPDTSEWNKKYKPEQMREDKNPSKNPKVIAKRMKTIKGRTKKIYGRPGVLNANWKGGIGSDGYTYEFNEELKLAVKIRDGKCKLCGLKEKLSVHHIDYDKKNNSLENLITLCSTCNSKVNGRRQNWIEYFSRERNVEKIHMTWTEIESMCSEIINFLSDKDIEGIYPIIRGGVIPAVIISHKLGLKIKDSITSDKDVIIDEIIDFGMTLKSYKRKYPNNLFVCLHLNKKNFRPEKQKVKPDFYVKEVDKFVRYPWEE